MQHILCDISGTDLGFRLANCPWSLSQSALLVSADRQDEHFPASYAGCRPSAISTTILLKVPCTLLDIHAASAWLCSTRLRSNDLSASRYFSWAPQEKFHISRVLSATLGAASQDKAMPSSGRADLQEGWSHQTHASVNIEDVVQLFILWNQQHHLDEPLMGPLAICFCRARMAG